MLWPEPIPTMGDLNQFVGHIFLDERVESPPTVLRRRARIHAANLVRYAGVEPLSVESLHGVLMGSDRSDYRQQTAEVIFHAGRIVDGDFPRASAVPQLMLQAFTPMYEIVFKTALAEWFKAEVAWKIYAIGFCIQPFARESEVLFRLLQNHVRQTHGLRWQTRLFSAQMEYEQVCEFRANVFKPTYAEFY